MYTVEQTFETLGDPCRRTCPTMPAAQYYADLLRRRIITQVAALPVSVVSDYIGDTERRAWDRAAAMSTGPDYSNEAANHIAYTAVAIENA